MINIADKPKTFRRSIAHGFISFEPSTFQRVASRSLPKGDALILAEVAGIQGAKMCSQLLPLCHPIELNAISLQTKLYPAEFKVEVIAEASCYGKTGVEMEALTAVNAALLCLHDLTKMFDPASTMSGICLLEKEGGKSGHWKNKIEEADSTKSPRVDVRSAATLANLKGVTISILTISDSCSQNHILDKTGPMIKTAVEDCGAAVVKSAIVADNIAEIVDFLREGIEKSAVLILTGGTGLGPRDLTPAALQRFCSAHGGFEIPGIGELLRNEGSKQTPMACLSRSGAYCVGSSLIFAFPGSVRAVEQGLELCVPLIAHMLAVRSGAKH